MPTVLQIIGLAVIALFVGFFNWKAGGVTAGVEVFALGLAYEAVREKPKAGG